MQGYQGCTGELLIPTAEVGMVLEAEAVRLHEAFTHIRLGGFAKCCGPGAFKTV